MSLTIQEQLQQYLSSHSEANLTEALLKISENLTLMEILNMTETAVCSQQQDLPTYPVLGKLEITISILGLILNGIAVFVIVTLRDFKKSISHWYVLQLAIADSVFLALLALKAHEHLMGFWNFPEWTCAAFQSFFMTNYYAGILFLTVMSFDRYVAIVHPVSAFWRKLRTHGNAVMITVAVWVVSILMAIPVWMWSKLSCNCGYNFLSISESDYGEQNSEFGDDLNSFSDEDIEESFIANIDTDEDKYQNGDESSGTYSLEERGGYIQQTSCHNPESTVYRAWLTCNFVITFLLPVIVMGICYSLILWRVRHPSVTSANKSSGRRKSREACSHQTRYSVLKSFRSSLRSTFSRSSLRNTSQKHKVTIIVVSLVAMFIICWLPFYVVQLIKFQGISSTAGCEGITNAVALLAYLNSMLNPIFYTFLGSRFYQRLCSAVRSIQRSNSNRSSIHIKYTRTSRTGAPTHGRTSASNNAHKGAEHSSSCHVNINHHHHVKCVHSRQ